MRSGILGGLVSLRVLSLALVASLAIGLGACADSEPAPPSPAAAPPAAAVDDSATITPAKRAAAARPAPLKRNAADANRLAGDGTNALKVRLASLKGHPVVVNQWASWCGPCRFEFPFFAAAVKRHAATVAFVGVNALDSRDSAQRFLDEQPPGFASIYDADGKAARAIGGGRAMPTTLFLGPDGRTRHTKLGGYPDAAALEADIRRYAPG